MSTAPSSRDLPQPRCRTARGGPACSRFSVDVEIITPVLGGGSQTRELDEVDVIRPATVRGHLRFWWRALCAHQYRSPGDLYRREGEIWGRAATDEGGRSAVEIRIDVREAVRIDTDDIGPATQGAYALWPARGEKGSGIPPAPRCLPWTRFQITVTSPASLESEVQNALRAWLLFGGYGSRTRRGLGSLRAITNPHVWLPVAATSKAFTGLFTRDVFAPADSGPNDTPWLAGAALHVGAQAKDPMRAWTTALDWLKEFRQGTSGPPGNRAREPGTGKPQSNRPSISNWPEPDKIRRLMRKQRAHPPRYNSKPAWPRAGFGLPIIGRFQTQGRERNSARYDEPPWFEILWRRDREDEETEHDRLASPLIVKALPLADGTFVPCALWLNRAYPGGQVILRVNGGYVNGSEAPFDLLLAPGDKAFFSALSGKQSLRQAFLDWLHTVHHTTVVAQ